MKMQIDPTVAYRVPQFSHQTSLAENWEELKKSISHSSSDFYDQIKNTQADDIFSLPGNLQHTIWKYFNRACYRGTPYGSFAGIGVCVIDKQNNVGVTISNDQLLHNFNDWTQTTKISFSFEDLIAKDVKLFTNTTFYEIGNTIRFIDKTDNGYEIAELEREHSVIEVLKICRYPTSISTLLANKPDQVSKLKHLSILENLISDGLLITELQPNLIGEDYFQRIKLPLQNNETKYIIAERPLISGALDAQPFKHIPALIHHLHQLLPSYKSPELDQFISRFNRKFTEREIPIMIALDPETGIGYGDMEASIIDDPLTEQLFKAKKKRNNQDDGQITIPLLLGKLLANNSTAIDLEQLSSEVLLENEPLPNSLPILCTEVDGKVHIDHIGGCSSTMLLGRFSHGSDAIYNHCKEIAEGEQLSNPEVLFFDIAYCVGTVTDNVNRHKSIYQLQLSILNYDTSKQPLTLDDLLLSVQGSELILRSKSLGMRLIPRMASAYNYQLSDLPVFRLLCDLQYQGIHKNLAFRLRDRLPDLPYYPEVHFRNIVLSPQSWRITLAELTSVTQDLNSAKLRFYLKSKGVSDFVRLGRADQILCLDLNKETDLYSFTQLIRKQKSIYLEQYNIRSTGLFKDEKGNAYQPQLLLNLRHNQTIYKGFSSNAIGHYRTNTPQIVPLGNHWLYFQIYCQPHRADELLLNFIYPFLSTLNNEIKQWFFIRYTENGHHLRLRLLLNNAESSYWIIKGMSDLLNEFLQIGVVSELLLRTYKREIERYGNENIDIVEAHFHKDSEYVTLLLNQQLSTLQRYHHCLSILHNIMESDVLGEDQGHSSIAKYADAFSKEHHFQPEQFKLINSSYKDYRKLNKVVVNRIVETAQMDLQNHWILLLRQYPMAQRVPIFIALVHMHVNRLFHVHQRIHEAIIYDFMQKEILRDKSRNNSITCYKA